MQDVNISFYYRHTNLHLVGKPSGFLELFRKILETLQRTHEDAVIAGYFSLEQLLNRMSKFDQGNLNMVEPNGHHHR